MSMEIEELQKVWNEQKGEHMYTINENALRKVISRKKNAAAKHVNRTEIGLILITIMLGSILTSKAIINEEGWWDLIGGIIILLTSLFVFSSRRRRKKVENTFNRTMIGELDHAIANTKSVMQIASSMVLWYLLPIGIFTYGQMLFARVSLDKFLLITGAFVLALFLIYWERKHYHIPRKEKLQKLRNKLAED